MGAFSVHLGVDSVNALDWSVVAVYLTGMISLSWYLGRKQADAKDYYLGGNDLSWWSVGISTMATQCSTNSLLGAPAFVITTGLIWLQYEFALPLAMVFIMIFLLPFYRKLNLVSVYAYQERRFGKTARTVLSVTFQFLRAFATGVTVYGISIVLESIIGLPFEASVIILGVVTIIYDMLGGMAAVVLSDVIQMVILYLGIVLCLVYSIAEVGGISEVFTQFSQLGSIVGTESFVGLQAIDFGGLGLTADSQYGFWPMLLGGLFLYVSYYGTDQTQVQRELSSKNIDDTNRSLMLNGMMRFPLVLTYCFLGVCIGAYIVKNPEFLKMLGNGDTPNYNLAVPTFVLHVLPNGVIGLVIVALFSAAMSSLDSTINSLSATTMKDIYEPFFEKKSATMSDSPGAEPVQDGEDASTATGMTAEHPDAAVDAHMSAGMSPVQPQEGSTEAPTASESDDTEAMKKQLMLSRIFTVFWGSLIVFFSFFVGDISNSVIESVNKIGSLANGPILAMFLLGILTRFGNEIGAITGLVVGLIGNALLWKFAPEVSWLWWNVFGFIVAFIVGVIVSKATGGTEKDLSGLVWYRGVDKEFEYEVNWPRRYGVMIGYSCLMILFCVGLTHWL